jgi:hypothetical protein
MTGRKCKAIRVLSTEGYGISQKRIGSIIEQISCRFNFPKFPMDKTEVLHGLMVIIMK